MGKKNKLVSLITSFVAIPIIAFSSGCGVINSDQIRIPYRDTYKTTINNIEYKIYTNMFQNTHHGSDILEVKGENLKRTYIGSFWIGTPEIDFVEGDKRYKVSDLSKEAKKVVYIQFLIDMRNTLKQKSNDEIRKILFDENTPPEEIEKLKQDYLLKYKLDVEDSVNKKFRDNYKRNLEEKLRQEGLEKSLLK